MVATAVALGGDPYKAEIEYSKLAVAFPDTASEPSAEHRDPAAQDSGTILNSRPKERHEESPSASGAQ